MNKIALGLGISAALLISSASAYAQSNPVAAVTTGKRLYDSEGKLVGSIYRVTPGGSPQIIVSGKLLTIPAATLSDVNGKITTSISKADVGRTR